jgi:AcrR family transcriptional regulator
MPTRPTPNPEPRVPLNRERVLSAALVLADEEGIESLTMRELGLRLGVEAMSLYNHVANKDDILDGIVDLVLNEIELPSAEEDWEAAIRKCAISAHDALLRHSWACNLIMSGSSVRPARLRYMESLLRRLREAGFSSEATYHAYHALDSHILGFTLWQVGHVMPGGGPRVLNKEEVAKFLATFLREFPLSEYPYLLEHAEQHFTEGSHKEEDEFEFVLRLILEGLERMLGTT